MSDISFIFQDRYILGSMTFNWLVCVWHAIISRFDHLPSYQTDLDFWAFITLIIIYALFQIVFYLLVLIKVSIIGMNFIFFLFCWCVNTDKSLTNEPAHDKTYSKICATSKDSN